MKNYIDVALTARGIDYMPICEICEKTRSHDVDHIDGRRGELMYCVSNLICLCRDCHTNKGGFTWKEKAKKIVKKKIDFI